METSAYHPFQSAQAKEEYLTHYDRRAKAWPIPSESRLVDTSFGQTFVRISGPGGAPPLVLLPGSVFNSLMWVPNIEALSKQYRTYAVDNIYDCGRSIYTRAPKSPDDFVRWLDELFTALELGDSINLMGLSYGSWLTNLYALRFPQRLAKIVLLAHPAVVSMNVEFVLRFLLCFVSPRYFASFVYWLFNDAAQKDEPSRRLVDDILEEMRLAGRCFKPKAMVTPKVMKDGELQGIKVPALFLMGENEKTFSLQKAIQRLNKVAPHLQTEIIPKAGHDLNFAQAELVNRRVLEFLQSTAKTAKPRS
jgi:pimeloyl-ACP methyl ester carboxylesterase